MMWTGDTPLSGRLSTAVLDLDGTSGRECAGASGRLWRSGALVENPPPAAIWDKRSVKQSIGYISLVVRDFRRYQDRGVVFVREPKTEGYGTVAVF